MTLAPGGCGKIWKLKCSNPAAQLPVTNPNLIPHQAASTCAISAKQRRIFQKNGRPPLAGPLREASVATLRQQIDMNLMTCLLCCRAAVGAMAGNGGRIVNVAARPALEWRSGAGMVAYAASKAAVAALTAALAEEVAKDGILVNAVAPSIMDTPANRTAMPKANYDLWPQRSPK